MCPIEKILPKAAAVQCANMNPELRPPSLTRKAGSSLRAEKLKVSQETVFQLQLSY